MLANILTDTILFSGKARSVRLSRVKGLTLTLSYFPSSLDSLLEKLIRHSLSDTVDALQAIQKAAAVELLNETIVH